MNSNHSALRQARRLAPTQIRQRRAGRLAAEDVWADVSAVRPTDRTGLSPQFNLSKVGWVSERTEDPRWIRLLQLLPSVNMAVRAVAKGQLQYVIV